MRAGDRGQWGLRLALRTVHNVAQEKARVWVWRTSQRRDPVTGKRYPWLYQD